MVSYYNLPNVVCMYVCMFVWLFVFFFVNERLRQF